MAKKAVKVNESENIKRASRVFSNINFKTLGKAVEALFTTSSAGTNHDCIGVAVLVIALLKKRGIDAELCVGDAAWRVDGQASGGVISHVSQQPGVSTVIKPESLDPNVDTFPFHAWIKLNEIWYCDFSTYQFQSKMDVLNQDGQNVPVTWKPPFLMFTKSDVSGYFDVANSFSAKVIYYSERQALLDKVNQKSPTADNDDLAALELIYNQIESGELETVIGPYGNVKLEKD